MCVCVCVCVCVYTYIYTYIHTYIHIWNTNTHIQRERKRPTQTDRHLHTPIHRRTHTHTPGSALSHLGWVNPNPLGCGRGGWYSFYETATRDMEVDIQRSSALLYWLLCISMHGFFSMEPCLHLNVIVTQAPFSFWRRPRLRWPATVAFVSPSMEAQKGLVSLIRPRFAIYGFSCFWPRTR